VFANWKDHVPADPVVLNLTSKNAVSRNSINTVADAIIRTGLASLTAQLNTPPAAGRARMTVSNGKLISFCVSGMASGPL
jgi:hypothetical protein